MPLTSAFTPPGTSSVDSGVTESSAGACPGGAASWELSASACVLVSGADQWAILTNWSIDVPDNQRIYRIKARVKVQPANIESITAQLYLGGQLIGDPQTVTGIPAGPTITTVLFDHEVNDLLGAGWNVDLSRAEVEGSGFGVKFVWNGLVVDIIYGASIQAEYGGGWKMTQILTKSFWRHTRIRTTGFWRHTGTRTTGYWRHTRTMTKEGDN